MNNTVIKTVQIVKLISQHQEGLTLTQIVHALELPKSTVFNILQTLESQGILTMRRDRSGVYQLGLETLKIGLSYLSGTSLDTAARPVLSQLCQKTNETVFLSVRSGEADLVYVMRYLPDSEFQTAYSVGAVRNLLSLAMGKAMLATMDEQELEHILKPEMFALSTLDQITDQSSLRRYLQEVRRKGYAEDATNENRLFAKAVASPVRDINGQLVCAISILMMRHPDAPDYVAQMGRYIHEAALEISHRLGYSGIGLF